MLHGDSKILEVARDASRVLRETRIDGAVIGGVAVVLHGYVRTTIDVDVFVPERAADFAAAITREGFRFDRSRREFVKGDVPIHIVTLDQLGSPPLRRKTIDNVLTVSLGDLITMKLRSGSRSVLRSIDLADVIGLIRAHRLTSTFAGRIDKSVRAEFRTLVRAVRSGG
ncbi:MAG: hypothetical protein HZB38_01570 [Planctomycetes bacterium]|nr:hypothetical protein [Planctomycetota bacterium]